MHDYTEKTVTAFRVDSTRGSDIAWFDVRKYDLAAVQMASPAAITCTLELVYALESENQMYATLFSPTKELTANPDYEGDIDTTSIAWIGARIKTAGASSEAVDLKFYATSANGTGLSESQTPMEGR